MASAKSKQNWVEANSAASPNTAPSWLVWLLAAVVFAATFIAFVPALKNQFLDWDDNTNFTENPNWRGLGTQQVKWMFSEFFNGHYQPITWLTLGLDFVISGRIYGDDPEHGYGMDPRVYHFSNVVYHCINAVLVYLIALRLLGYALLRRGDAQTRGIHFAAACAALLWSVHPLRVENVAWITERRDLIGAMFLLLTVLAYLRAARLQGGSRWIWLAVSLVLYVISLMAKVSGAPLAIVLLAIDWYPLRRFARDSTTSRTTLLLKITAFLAAGLYFSYNAARFQSERGWMYGFDIHPLHARLLVCMYGTVFYAWKTLAPFELQPLYELLIPMDTGALRYTVTTVIALAMGILVLSLLIMRKLPGVVVATVCYGAFLAPVLGLFQNGPQLVADRYAYLPSIGLMILVASGGLWWASKNPARRTKIVATAGCIIIAALGVMAWRQSQVWRTSETLWTRQLEIDENCAVAHFNMGNVYFVDRRQPAEAVPFYRKAIELDPAAKKYRNNLRNALREAGMFPELVQSWLDEASLFGADPSFKFNAGFHRQAGTQALLQEKNDFALEHLTVSVLLEPNAEALNNLAMVYDRMQRPDDAIDAYRKSIELGPKLVNPRFGLALVLSKQGKTADARRELEALLQIKPDDAKARNLLDQLKQSQ